MAPLVQNTFSIIPDVPSVLNSRSNGDATSTRMSMPPMTSKQVKKAYRKATKGPRLSKAEQRRQELFEQDRIRKESEKERNKARARAARDKKKEKADRERAEKKNKGMPLVDVRPSQNTLASFIRARPGNTRTVNGSASPSVATEDDESEKGDSCLSPPRNGPKGSYEAQLFDDADKENVAPRSHRIQQCLSPVHVRSEDNSIRGGLSDKPPIRDHAEPPNKKRRVLVAEEVEKQSEPNVHDEISAVDSGDEELLNDLMRKTDNVYGRSPTPPPDKSVSRPQQDQKTSIKQSPLKPLEKPNPARENKLPPSTQLFFLSHLDDFFPSPSQEVREIFEEPECKINTKRNKTASTSVQVSTPSTALKKSHHVQHITDPPKPRAATVQPNMTTIPPKQPITFEMPFFCTQDLLLSSQDVKDIEETSLPPSGAQASTPVPSMPPAEPRHPSRPSPKPLSIPSYREIHRERATEHRKQAAWENTSVTQKARGRLDRPQALEDGRITAPHANPAQENKERGNRKASGFISARSYIAKDDTALKLNEPHTTSSRSTPKSQVQPPRPVRPGPRRNARPKSSYETMLELLAKGSAQQKQSPAAPADKNKTRNGRVGGSNVQATNEPKPITIPASQETDYDGGEEWDDDDLLRDIL
ncbi:hypothetical protein F4861DRAFT_514263 [Xylaria intraflava]|nr:hypothetical protein F4861DRAFT_514263 [Xylaria intraflava]